MTVLVVDGAALRLTAFGRSLPCRIGRSGTIAAEAKREGDGATPVGRWPVRGVLLRPDRVALPGRIALPWRWLAPADGWCDDPADSAYNRPVRHPFPRSAERLWFDAGSYDVVVVLGYNDTPPVPGRGSAIFLHCSSAGGSTDGCVAIDQAPLAAMLPQLAPGDILEVC